MVHEPEGKLEKDPFNNVRNKFKSSQVNQNTVSLLLAAVEESIKEKGLDLSPTAYFANFLALIAENMEEPNQQLNVDASLSLLVLILPHVPAPVLRHKFEECISTLVECLEYGKSHIGVIKHCLGCLTHLLVSLDSQSWSAAEVNMGFQNIIYRILDSRPKVRKEAQNNVHYILNRPPPPLLTHPGAVSLTRNLLQAFKKINTTDPATVCHLLSFLKDSWQLLDPKKLKSLAGAIFCLMNHTNDHVIDLSFQAIKNLCAFMCHIGESNGIAKHEWQEIATMVLTHEANGSRVSKYLNHWLQSIFYVTRFCKDKVPDEKLGEIVLSSYERAFSVLRGTYSSDSITSDAFKSAENACKMLIDFILEEKNLFLVKNEQFLNSQLVAVLEITRRGLSLAFENAWKSVFGIISYWLSSFSKSFPQDSKIFILFDPLIEMLADDDVYGKNDNFPHKQDFEEVIKGAIACYGIENFLKRMPLNVLEDSGSSRAWLLPLIRSAVKRSRLNFFLEEFVPLSVEVSRRGKSFFDQNMHKEAKLCGIVWRQIWECMPKFCRAPIDLQDSFDPFLEIVSPILESDNEDRLCLVFESLRSIVAGFQITSDTQLPKINEESEVSINEAQAAIAFLSKYSSRVMPLLINNYILTHRKMSNTDKSSQKGHMNVAMLAIKSWVTVCGKQDINNLFTHTLQNYLKMDDDKLSLLDISIALIESRKLDENALNVLNRVTVLGICSEDAHVQKKCYKAICLTYEIDALKSIYWGKNSKFLDSLRKQVRDSLFSTANASKKERFCLLKYLTLEIDTKSSDSLSLIPAIVSEVILGTKEVSEKTRQLAYELLILMAKKMLEAEKLSKSSPLTIKQNMGDDNSTENEPLSYEMKATLVEYLNLLVAGLAGKTPHMISASIQALARVMYELQNELPEEVTSGINEAVVLYALQSPNREIIKSALSYIKVVISVFSEKIVESSRNDSMDEGDFNLFSAIVKACLTWTSEHKSHFKVTCRYILERLERKCGMEKLEQLVPAQHYKLLSSIRKRKERKIKKIKENTSQKKNESFFDIINNDSEEIPEVFGDMIRSRKGARDRYVDAISEDEQDPLDFLDKKSPGKLKKRPRLSPPSEKTRLENFSHENGKLVFEEMDISR